MSLLGIQKVVLAVNKMDAVDFSEEVFWAIAKTIWRLRSRLVCPMCWRFRFRRSKGTM